MNERIQVRKSTPRGPRGERGAINQPQIDGPFIQWQSPDGTWDDLSLRVNTLGPEGPSGDAQYFSTRSQAIAHNITTGLPAIKTYGYHTPGDGGGATYKLVTTDEDFTSLDGQKWALAEPIITPLMTGATTAGVVAAQDAFDDAFDLTDEIVVPPGMYRFSANRIYPRGKRWRLMQGAIISIDSGVVLTIHGELIGAFFWHFRGDGTVVGLRHVRDVWFGTNGSITATSATSIAIGSGSKTFTTSAGLAITIGARLRAYVGSQAVTGAANNGSGLIRIAMASTALYTTGQSARVSGVVGTAEANAKWVVTVVDGTHLDLQGSTFTNAYTSGGEVLPVSRWVEGIVTAYSGTSLTILVDDTDGSGTYTNWVIQANDHPALTRMIAAIENDASAESDGNELLIQLQHITFPIAQTVVFTPTVIANLRVRGAGSALLGTTFLALPDFLGGTTGSAVRISGSDTSFRSLAEYTISSFSIVNSPSGDAASGILFGGDTELSGLYLVNLAENIHVVLFQIAWIFRAVRLVEVRRSSANIENIPNSIGMLFDVTEGLATGDIDVYGMRIACSSGVGSTSVFLGNSFEATGLVASSLAGIRFHGGEWYRADVHIEILGSNGAYIGDIDFGGYLQCDGPAGRFARVRGTGANTNVNKVNFENIWANTAQTGVFEFSQSSSGKVKHCKVTGCEINFSSGPVLTVDGCQGIKFYGNRILGMNPGSGQAAARFAGSNKNCSFNDNTLIPFYDVTDGVASYFVQWETNSDYFNCIGNNAGGHTGLTGDGVRDLSTTIHKVIANNL